MSTSTAAARPACDRPACDRCPACDRRPACDRCRDWRSDAACRDADPELFFPDGDIRSARAHVKTAKLICRGCPVSATCLTWALTNGQEAGIWGGLTEDERRRLHRRGFRPAADSLTKESS
jgi:WhiB family transcriptional regulator, redox-sensing transcriptional regulator